MISRDVSTARCLLVWAVVGSVAVAAIVDLAPPGLHQALVGRREDRFDVTLVGCCTLALVVCAVWAWLVTTSVVVRLLRTARAPTVAPGLLRRLVLLACGVALTTTLAAPALATPGPDPVRQGRDRLVALLSGLPLPERAVDAAAPAHVAHPTPSSAPADTPAPTATVRVQPGDSLWHIAANRLTATTAHPTEADIDRAWREIYAANRGVVGADPDLITPATRLHLPDLTRPADQEAP